MTHLEQFAQNDDYVFMFKCCAKILALTSFCFVVGCSPKSASVDVVPISVRSELATLNPGSAIGSARTLTSSDIQYLETEVALTPDQKAALLEVAQ